MRSKRSSELAADPAYSNVTVLVEPAAIFSIPVKADVVWTSQNYHDYLCKFMGPVDTKLLARSILQSLKPGGVFVVVDHAAEEGSGSRDTEATHRVDPQLVQGAHHSRRLQVRSGKYGACEIPTTRTSTGVQPGHPRTHGSIRLPLPGTELDGARRKSLHRPKRRARTMPETAVNLNQGPNDEDQRYETSRLSGTSQPSLRRTCIDHWCKSSRASASIARRAPETFRFCRLDGTLGLLARSLTLPDSATVLTGIGMVLLRVWTASSGLGLDQGGSHDNGLIAGDAGRRPALDAASNGRTGSRTRTSRARTSDQRRESELLWRNRLCAVRSEYSRSNWKRSGLTLSRLLRRGGPPTAKRRPSQKVRA